MTIRILVVNDDPTILELTKAHLERDDDISVDVAESAQTAKDLLSAGKYDAVISDYQLSDEMGIEILRYVRSTGIQVPFVIFTGKGREDVVIDALNAGADAYIQNGGRPEAQFADLLCTVRDLVERNRSKRKLQEIQSILKNLIDNLPAFVFLRDLEGRYLAVNKMFCELLGIPENEILGRKDEELSLCELAKKLTKGDAEVASSGRLSHSQDHGVFKGKEITVTITKIPINDSDGRTGAVATMAYDTSYLTHIEQALLKQVQLFSNVLESVQDGLCVLDRDMNVLYANSAMNRIYPPFNPPIIGKKCYYAYDNKTSRCPDCNAWRAIEKKEIIRERIFRRDPDDKERWIEVFHFPLIDSQTGNSEGVILYLRDITHRRLAERALSDGDRFISEVLSSIQDGVSILDKDLNIVRVNTAMERWYAHALPLVGKKCYEAYHGRTEPCEVCPTKRTLASGKPSYEIVPKTGPERVVVGWLDLYSFPIKNPKTAEIEGVIEYVRDVTDREKAKAELEAKHQQLLSIFNSIDDLIYVSDPETYEVLFVNEAVKEMLGDVVGKKCYKVFQGFDAPCPFCTNDKIFGKNIGLSYTWEHQNLVLKRWFRCTDRAIMWSDNRFVRFEMAIDITDLKSAEEKLRQTNLKLNILGDVTRHDTLNKLATIQLYLDLMRNTCKDSALLQCIEKIADASSFIKEQFEFISDYQKIGVKSPEWINVRTEFDNAVKGFAMGNISIRNELADMDVYADPMLGKVFYNLIENSLKHGRTVTEIAIRGEELEEGYRILYEDNGVGIPPEQRPMIFKARVGEKSGFGMYLAAQICAITGLSIRLQEGSYAGTRVELIIPPGKFRIWARKRDAQTR